MIYKELFIDAIHKLDSAGIESARLNAELLLCKCADFQRIELRLNYSTTVPNTIIDEYARLISARCNRLPLQYLLETILFYDINLRINNTVLIPRHETEQLVDIIKHKCNINNKNILDICSGSGCIALALGKCFSNAKFTGIDISKEAISLANENANLLDINNVTFINASIEEYIPDVKFDIVVCNPPYISLSDYNNLEQELFYEPRIALTDGSDGLSFYRTISNKLDKLLDKDGKLFFECGINQAEEIANIYLNIGYMCNIIKDMSDIDRYLEINL